MQPSSCWYICQVRNCTHGKRTSLWLTSSSSLSVFFGVMCIPGSSWKEILSFPEQGDCSYVGHIIGKLEIPRVYLLRPTYLCRWNPLVCVLHNPLWSQPTEEMGLLRPWATACLVTISDDLLLRVNSFSSLIPFQCHLHFCGPPQSNRYPGPCSLCVSPAHGLLTILSFP